MTEVRALASNPMETEVSAQIWLDPRALADRRIRHS